MSLELNWYSAALLSFVGACAVYIVFGGNNLGRFLTRYIVPTVVLLCAGWVVALFLYSSWNSGSLSTSIEYVRRAPGNREVILLVHGWNSEGAGWKELESLLSADERFATRDIARLRYPARSIAEVGNTLNAVTTQLANVTTALLPRQQLSFIAHSTGGVLIRAMLVGDPRFHHMGADIKTIAIASPFLGVSAASIAPDVGVSPATLDDLRIGSRFLVQLRLAWARRQPNNTIYDLCLVSRADSMVTVESGSDGCTQTIKLDGWSHTAIASPNSPTDERYVAIAQFLARQVSER